jgi:hypothetical protein
MRNSTYSILELACCLITSRHLNPNLRSVFAPRLQKSTEEFVLQVVLEPHAHENLQVIQALLILSLWLPVCGTTDSTIWDGSLLIASAVNIAMNLGLNEASKQILNVSVTSPVYRDLHDKARLVRLLFPQHPTVLTMTCI